MFFSVIVEGAGSSVQGPFCIPAVEAATIANFAFHQG